MNNRMARVRDNFTDDAAAALLIEAEKISGRAKDEFVPVDKGPLRSSIHVTEVVRKLFKLTVSIVAGGVAEAYAVAVHETPSKFDPPPWRGKVVKFTRGGAKFIFRPMMLAIPGMSQRIANRIKLRT